MPDTTNYRFAVHALASELAARCTSRGIDQSRASVAAHVRNDVDDHLVGSYPGEWPEDYYTMDEPGYAHGCGPQRLAALATVRERVVSDVVDAVQAIRGYEATR